MTSLNNNNKTHNLINGMLIIKYLEEVFSGIICQSEHSVVLRDGKLTQI